MKFSKKTKFVIGLILAIIVLVAIFKDTLHRKLVFEEIAITAGCVVEFCIGDNKEEVIEVVKVVLAQDSAELWYKATDIPTHSPDDLNHEKLVNNDLWTIFIQKKFGFTRAYYLYFEGDVIAKIKVRKYGPFYFDL